MSPSKHNKGDNTTMPSNDKENVDLQSSSKLSNRRDSLGKGILKNLKPSNQNNNTVHLMQLPLRDAQVRDSSTAGKKSYRRRVSFAPEVTLHKIDLIQPLPQPQEKPPRRRETIAFAPYTSRVDSPEKPAANFEDNAEEIMYDSSDAEMEDDSHVYSSSPAKSQLGFEIHQDKEEYTETIDMSISRDTIIDNYDERTMELTKPLGEIQLSAPRLLPVEENPLFQSTQNSQESQSYQSSQSTDSISGSQSAFGSIKSLFDDEDEEQEESLEMELTQPINKTIEIPVTKTTDVNQDNKSETTINESSMDETMDISNLVEGSTARITHQNTLLNRQIFEKGEISMDQTQLYGNINQLDANITEELTQSMLEVTMVADSQPTTAQKKISQPTETEITPIRKANNGTPLKAVRSHTSETGSPHSSKRKYQPDSELVANSLRERINSLTPKKKRKSILELEKVKVPSLISGSIAPSIELLTSSQDHHRVSFTPLRSQRGSLINGRKIEIGSFIDTAPLAPSHEQDITEEQEYQPVTLQKFLNDLSVEFFDDLNVNEDFTIDLKPIKKGEKVNPVDFIIAKNSKLPWIELYNFSCDELQSNMNELKKLFDNLNEEFSEENPLLVKEYYETSGLIQQKKMNDRLLLMKTYSDKEAESAWYSWRYKLLDELDTRLNTNSRLLNEDFKTLTDSSNEINRIQSLLVNKKNDLEFKLDEALAKKDEIDSEQTSELIQLRTDMISELTQLSDDEARLRELESDIEYLDASAVDTTTIEEEIVTKQTYIDRNSQEPIARLKILLETLDKLQSISGLKFNSINETIFDISLIGFDIRVNVNLLDLTDRKVIMPSNLTEITRNQLNDFLSENSDLSLPELIYGLRNIALAFKKLHDELFYLSLEFPTKVEFNDGVNINILEFNKSERYKVNININMTKSQILESNLSSNVQATLIYGSKDLKQQDILSSLKMKLQSSIIDNIETLNLVRN